MKQKFIVRGYMAFAEQDNFENGCFGPGKHEFVSGNDWTLSRETLAELIADLCDEFKAEPDEVLLNSCDEMGRLDLQVQQRQPFMRSKLAQSTIDKFKTGKIDLWSTNYIFQIELVSIDIDLALILETEKGMSK